MPDEIIIDGPEDPPAPPLSPRYQCQWCNNAATATGFCVPCGDRAGKCRAPRWNDIKFSITNSLRSQWTIPLAQFSPQTGCCGVWQENLLALPGYGPYYQWGYWEHFRYLQTETWLASHQDRIPPSAYEPKDRWTYTTFRTGAAVSIWWYFFQLTSYRLAIQPVLVSGVCKLRVSFTIYGYHNVAQLVKWKTNDGRPNTGCHIELFDGITGYASASYNVAYPCLPSDSAPLCFGDWFDGVNPNAGMMAWYEEQESETPNLGVSYPFAKSFCKDFDALPSTPIAVASMNEACGTTCGVQSFGSIDPPAIERLVTWEASSSTGGNTCVAFPAATLGPSPYSDCNPITPTPAPGSGFQRFYRHCQTASTFDSELMDGSSPDPVIAPLDLGTWTLQFSL